MVFRIFVNLSDEEKKIYLDRLEEELDMYSKMGFSSYPLVLQEIIDEAKSRGIMIGPGRGCLLAGTKVLIKRDGKIFFSHIEDVVVGDLVLDRTITDGSLFIIQLGIL